MTVDDPIERCKQEIAAMQEQTDAPAWLVTLGITDWQMEMELLESLKRDEAWLVQQQRHEAWLNERVREMEILNANETRQKSGCNQQQYFRADEHGQTREAGGRHRVLGGEEA